MEHPNRVQKTEKTKLLERIDKLEFCLLLIANQLNGVPNFPQDLLKKVKAILLNREKPNI